MLETFTTALFGPYNMSAAWQKSTITAPMATKSLVAIEAHTSDGIVEIDNVALTLA